MCLQIGTEKQGLSGWFRKEDLAFGDAVNRVICDFPSYDRDLFADAKTLGEVIPGVESKENPQAADVWLIGTLPDGSWLVEVNGEEVVRAVRVMKRIELSFTLHQRNTETASPPKLAVSCTAVIK